jgi:hypothetical protein
MIFSSADCLETEQKAQKTPHPFECGENKDFRSETYDIAVANFVRFHAIAP